MTLIKDNSIMVTDCDEEITKLKAKGFLEVDKNGKPITPKDLTPKEEKAKLKELEAALSTAEKTIADLADSNTALQAKIAELEQAAQTP